MFLPMHHKDRDKDHDRYRHRDRDRGGDKDKDGDRDRDRDRGGDKQRHRNPEQPSPRHYRRSRSHRKSANTSTRSLATPQPPSTPASSSPKRRAEMPTESNDRPASLASLSTSRLSLPYPSFSKAHSKESLLKDNVTLRQSIYTHNSTATPPQSKHPAESSERLRNPGKRSQAEGSGTNGIVGGRFAPPSPPATQFSVKQRPTPVGAASKMNEELPREASGDDAGDRRKGTESPASSSRITADPVPRSRASKHSLRKEASSILKDGDSTVKASSLARSSSAPSKKGRTNSQSTTPQPDARNDSASPRLPPARREAASPTPSTEIDSGLDSDATSRARNQPFLSEQPPPLVDADASYPTTLDGSSPRTPPLETPGFPPRDDEEAKASPTMVGEREPQPLASYISPRPPPPPPPPMVPQNIPRVDYLLQGGGLPYTVPRALLSSPLPSPTLQSPYGQHSPKVAARPPTEVERIFSPYHKRLDDFSTILSKNGSLAVATGYRSVARRLLDRLEAVFARDISSESCSCVMCQQANHEDAGETESIGQGVGWGDVLEWVCGRGELPAWPPFDFSNLFDPINKRTSVEEVAGLMGLGIMDRAGSPAQRRRSGGANRPASPIQRLDADLPEEYRAHYLRQFKKTKDAVNSWLSSCPETPSSPPQEIDDETLVFAILTHLDRADRDMFNALISLPLQSEPPATPPKTSRPELLITTGFALQRLYRLPIPPRDAESAIFLLRNPNLHGILATLAVISPAEWEVLTSGRFDGFLWSGAEADPNYSNRPSANPSPAPFSRGPSQRPTPLSRASVHTNGGQSRGPTPFSNGGPSRGPTPFSPIPSRMTTPFYAAAAAASRGVTPAPGALGNPVPLDEETEIAVLAEVEREIYVGMEALEDAFEALHRKAENVRRALRERGAGLTMASLARRNPQLGGWGDLPAGIEVMGGTPGMGHGWESEAETDDGLDDCQSELMPDDSASNISSSRHRRPKRRNERRTPAPVSEEEEKDSQA